MFNKNINLREWRDWIGFAVGVILPAILWLLESMVGNIIYFICTGTAIILFSISIFVKSRKIHELTEEKDNLNEMLSQPWEQWGDDELSKNPKAWETLRDYLDHSFSVNNVPDKIRHNVLTSFDDIEDYISVAWTPMEKHQE